MQNLSHENEFDLHENEHIGETHFQVNGFAAWLAQLVEHQSAVREVEVRAPHRTNTQGLKITEENVLPL